jgi:hypothetical protein
VGWRIFEEKIQQTLMKIVALKAISLVPLYNKVQLLIGKGGSTMEEQ